jgi:hypothetical protein
MFLISPVAPEPSGGAATATQAQPLSAAKALRLGILDNGKGNADHLLRFVAERLQQLFPVESLVWLRKASMSHPAQQEIYDRLVSETDFVVSAIAD